MYMKDRKDKTARTPTPSLFFWGHDLLRRGRGDAVQLSRCLLLTFSWAGVDGLLMDDSDKGDGLASASPPTAKRRWFLSCLTFFLRLGGSLGR